MPIGKMGVKSSHMYLVLCYGTITKGKLTVGKAGYKKEMNINKIIPDNWLLSLPDHSGFAHLR